MSILLSISITVNDNSLKIVLTINRSIGIILTLLLLTLITIFNVLFLKDIKRYVSYLDNNKESRYEDAEIALNKARKNSLNFLFRGLLNWHRYVQTGNSTFLEESKIYLQLAIIQNDQDIQLRAFYAVIQYYLEGYDSAYNTLAYLVDRFPNNTSFRLYYANMLYINGELDLAARNYANAIMLTPSIMENQGWCSLLEKEEYLSAQIKNLIKFAIIEVPTDPILLAKYGKLWYLFGEKNIAEEYLLKAVEILPNLESPWYLLAQIANSQNDTDKMNEYNTKLKLWGHNSVEPNLDQRYDETGGPTLVTPSAYSNYLIKCSLWYRAPLTTDIFDYNFNMASTNNY